MEVQVGGFLPRARDSLTAKFLRSSCTHMLNVDADIGWQPEDVQALLDSGKSFISGCYAKRHDKLEIPAKLTGVREGEKGELWEADYVPGGFLLIERAVIERMVGAYHDLQYRGAQGMAWALWAEFFEQGVTYDGEDVSFCKRWRRLGGQVWLHQGVTLDHVGDHVFRPDALVAK